MVFARSKLCARLFGRRGGARAGARAGRSARLQSAGEVMRLQSTDLQHKGVILERLTAKARSLTTLQAQPRLCKATHRVQVPVIKPRARHAADALVTTAASRYCECSECEKAEAWIPLVVDFPPPRALGRALHGGSAQARRLRGRQAQLSPNDHADRAIDKSRKLLKRSMIVASIQRRNGEMLGHCPKRKPGSSGTLNWRGFGA